MTRHILLTFLSDVKKKGPKNGPWSVCKSKYDEIGDTYTTNESAVRYLLKKGWNEKPIQLERIFAFASNTVLENKVGANREDLAFPDNSIDENGISLTHLEYFKKRIADIVDIDLCMPEVEGLNHEDSKDPVCLYNDESEDIKLTMTSVIGMSGKIQKYFQEVTKESQGDQEVILHADMSGGFRHAAMMMMAVMRLIQFAGIKIGHVMYSNWSRLDNDPEYSGEGVVQEVGEIYGMYDLVSGAAEFTNFGSVKSFKEYFNNRQQSRSLKKLIIAMEEFDEAIKISKLRGFKDAVAELNKKLLDFRKEAEVEEKKYEANLLTDVDLQKSSDINDLLMLSFENRIKNEYKDLFEAKDNIVYVEWCVKHDYLQQALTLYTETLPNFLIENKFITVTERGEKGFQKEIEENGRFYKDPRPKEYLLLNEYTPDKSIPALWLDFNKDKAVVLCNMLRNYLNKLTDLGKIQEKIRRTTITAKKAGVAQIENDIKDISEKINELLKNETQNLSEKIKVLLEEEYVNKKQLFEDDRKQISECLTVLQKVFTEGFINTLSVLTDEQKHRIEGFISYDKNKVDFKTASQLKNIIKQAGNLSSYDLLAKILNKNKIQWNSIYERSNRIELLLYCNEFEINSLKPEELLPIIDNYFYLKAIRNDSVHAKLKNTDVQEYTAKEIKSNIQRTLQNLRALEAKMKCEKRV